MKQFTPTEQRFYDLFSDGSPHSILELIRCLHDWESGEKQNVKVQISSLRKKIRGQGLEILIQYVGGRGLGKKMHYRMVRTLHEQAYQ